MAYYVFDVIQNCVISLQYILSENKSVEVLTKGSYGLILQPF